MKALVESKKDMGKECQDAFFLMAEAKYAAGDFQYICSNQGARLYRLPNEQRSDSTNLKKILRVC